MRIKLFHYFFCYILFSNCFVECASFESFYSRIKPIKSYNTNNNFKLFSSSATLETSPNQDLTNLEYNNHNSNNNRILKEIANLALPAFAGIVIDPALSLVDTLYFSSKRSFTAVCTFFSTGDVFIDAIFVKYCFITR